MPCPRAPEPPPSTQQLASCNGSVQPAWGIGAMACSPFTQIELGQQVAQRVPTKSGTERPAARTLHPPPPPPAALRATAASHRAVGPTQPPRSSTTAPGLTKCRKTRKLVSSHEAYLVCHQSLGRLNQPDQARLARSPQRIWLIAPGNGMLAKHAACLATTTQA